MLNQQQIDFYREEGYLLVEQALTPRQLDDVRAITDELLEQARFVRESNEAYEIDEGHTPDRPRVQRIKRPDQRHPLFLDLVRSERLLGFLQSLLGPDIRLHSCKLNTKPGGFGAAVEWHQDWAYYPHTNDDLLAIGIFLDDVEEDNGPLMVLPRSHRGPIYSHHRADGFVGGIDPVESGLDVSGAVNLTGPAGSMSIHHARTVHGSNINCSDRPRRLLLYELCAADAWPLAGAGKPWMSFEFLQSLLLCGSQTLEPRLAAVPVRVPLPEVGDHSSIYRAQRGMAHRHFSNAGGSIATTVN